MVIRQKFVGPDRTSLPDRRVLENPSLHWRLNTGKEYNFSHFFSDSKKRSSALKYLIDKIHRLLNSDWIESLKWWIN